MMKTKIHGFQNRQNRDEYGRERYVVGVMVLTLIAFSGAACGRRPADAELMNKSKIKFAAFQSELQRELSGAVGRGGFVEAVAHCRKVSPGIEGKAGHPKLVLRRVSDKARNPTHVPDAFERRILSRWKQSLVKGDKIGIVGERVGETYRVMKPIRIANAMCLKCHGGPGQLDAKAAKKIRELYPKDQATGYKVGELRGAFSAVWPD